MAKNWWFKFDFGKWQTDSKLRRCSFETRGFWIQALCVMHESENFQIEGTYEELSWLLGCPPEVVARCVTELKRSDAADVTLGNGIVTVASRRLKRELSDREKARLRVQRHRSNADVTAQSKSKSNKQEIREEEEKREEPPQAAAPRPKLHPAIQAIKTISGHTPANAIRPDLISVLGESFDRPRLEACFKAWAAKGYRSKNLAWVTEWYVNGIPSNGNGYGKPLPPPVGLNTEPEQTYSCRECFDTGERKKRKPGGAEWEFIYEGCGCVMEEITA